MPRPPKKYSVPQPIEPINLEELKFWLRILEEHMIFVKGCINCEDTNILQELDNFHKEFCALRARAEKNPTGKRFLDLVGEAQATAKELVKFQRHLLCLVLTCKLSGCNYPLFLDHITRETEYVIGLLEKIKECKPLTLQLSKAEEEVFWVRIMADHTKFICHLLDPSERNLIKEVTSFSTEFDDLFLQGKDFASMLHCCACPVPSFARYSQDVCVSTMRLRDFKKAAYEMIKECKLLGIMPALLADHVRREADHFLMILSMIDRGILKEADCEDELEDYVQDEDEIEEIKDMGLDEFSENCKEPQFDEDEEEDELPILKKSPKYKWGDKWPKPLGR